MRESLGKSRVPAILGRRKIVFGEILSFLGTDLGDIRCLKGLKYGYERNIEQ